MNNLKKIALSGLVACLAIGFSAFTNAEKNTIKVTRNAEGKIISVTASYYRIPANASTSTDLTASHYVFSNSPLANCDSGTSNICSSEWTTENAPTNGQSPADAGSPVFVSDKLDQGIYNEL